MIAEIIFTDNVRHFGELPVKWAGARALGMYSRAGLRNGSHECPYVYGREAVREYNSVHYLGVTGGECVGVSNSISNNFTANFGIFDSHSEQ